MIVRTAPAILLALALAAPARAGREEVRTPIPDTGQTICLGDRDPIDGPAPGEAYFGQDAQYAGNGPSYRDDGDGTVVDLVTGLTWQKTPDFVVRTLDDALAYAKALRLGGHDDWRLPTIKELFSLADFRGNMHARRPYLDTRFFNFEYPDPATGARDMDGQYWSSTRYLGRTMRGDESAFGFNFADGRIKSYPTRADPRGGRRGRLYVRCVRGPAYGANDFRDGGDGTVTDRATGLTWTKATCAKPLTWREALAWAENLELAGHDDWRLPKVKELQSLVDYSRAPDAAQKADRGPAIDPVFDLASDDAWCWASTTHLENRYAYYVAFGMATSAWEYGGKPMNAHGAGAVRSDPKTGDPADYAGGHGPQGDEIRIRNYAFAVRGGAADPVKDGPGAAEADAGRTGPGPGGPGRGGRDFVSRLDRDGDGKVSREEFDGPPERFRDFDKDGDGFISADEAPTGPPPRRGPPPGGRRR